MATGVEVSTQDWGQLVDGSNHPLVGLTPTLEDLDGNPVTVYADEELTTPLGGPFVSDADGLLPGFVAVDTYQLIEPLDLTVREVQAVSGSLLRSVERSRPVVVTDPVYGAVGDGVTDDQPAIQAAVLAALLLGVGVYLPAGRYYLGAAVELHGVHIFGESAELTRVITNDGWTGAAFTSTGSIGAEIDTSGSFTSGDTDLVTGSAHGLADGDWARIVGQRNSLNETDAGAYWLGDEPTNTVYFGEFLEVLEADTTTTFTSRTPLIFPDYLDTDAGETDANARPSSTIQKMTFSVKPLVEKIGFDVQGSPGNSTGVVEFVYALKGRVRDCDFDLGAFTGQAVIFRDSHKCRADVRVERATAPSASASYNSLKGVSSQQCWFDGSEVEGGYQAVDFTYSPLTGGIASVYCGVIWSRFDTQFDAGMTSHHGTFGTKFHLNAAAGCERGIYGRGHSLSIKGNDFDNMAYAIGLSNVRGADVIGNTGNQLGSGLLVGLNQGSTHDVYGADNVFKARVPGDGIGVWGMTDAADIQRIHLAGGRMENFDHGVYVGSTAEEWNVEDVKTPGCTNPITLLSADTTHRFDRNRPSGSPTQLEETWRKFEPRGGQMDAISGDRILLADATSAASSGNNMRGAFWLDPEDYEVLGRGLKLRVEVALATNDVAPGISFDVELRPVTASAGAAATVSATLGAAVATTPAIATPAANSLSHVVGTEIDFPAAGLYVFYADLSGGMAASSAVVMRANLAVRHDSS